MTNKNSERGWGGARPNTGPKPKANRYKPITVTLPPETYDLIMSAKGDGNLSATVTQLLNEALFQRGEITEAED